MNETLQVGYTCSQAASMAISRLERGITKGSPEYEAVHDSYLKSFFHYAGMCSTLLVGKKRLLPNSFVEAMISYLGSRNKEERQRLTAENIEEMVEDTPAFIAKTSKTYSQVKAAGILQISRQTIIHWMNDGWMDYILIGDVRRSLKREVDKMLEYRVPGKKKEDHTRYKKYFIRKGVWQKQQGRYIKLIRYESLTNKCSDLENTISELRKEVRNDERVLKESKKERAKLANQFEAMKGRYETATSENKAANKRIGQLETQFERLQKKYESAETENSNLSKLLKAANKDTSDLTTQVQRLNEENQRTAEQYKALLEALKTKKEEVVKLSANVRELGKKNARLQQQYDTLLSGNKASKNNLAVAAKQRIDGLKTEVEELQKQNSKLQQQNEELQENIDELSTRIAIYETEAEKAKGSTEPIETQEYKPPEQVEGGLAGQVQRLHQENISLTDEIKSLRAQLKARKQKGKQDVRIYRPSETYKIGERIEHTLWETFGKVVSVSGDCIDVLFEDEKVGKKTLIQGRKLCP